MRKMNLTLFFAVLVLLLGLSAQNDSLALENLASDGRLASHRLVQPQEDDMKTKKSPHLDITSKILEANKGINRILVEGDVALSKKRNAIKCWSNYCKWSKSYNGLVEVPYTLSDYFYDNERALIEKAMETFHKKTCVRFVPYRGQADYLSIESEIGCWSSVGRNGGQQVVSLSVYGCLDHGIIQHELLHALGFHHEHNRSDRDQYVRINWENIPKLQAFNFHKMDTNNLNTPYDYSSVMHYGRTAFTSQYGAETITPIPHSSVAIGQRDDMSDIDILRINRLYRCNI